MIAVAASRQGARGGTDFILTASRLTSLRMCGSMGLSMCHAHAHRLIVGLGRRSDPGTSARLGTAAAALVAQGLGSDAGIVDLQSTLEFWRSRAEELGSAPPLTPA